MCDLNVHDNVSKSIVNLQSDQHTPHENVLTKVIHHSSGMPYQNSNLITLIMHFDATSCVSYIS